MNYLVHINQQSDGSLPPDQWVKVKAGSMTDAIVEVLSNRPDHDQPTKAFVALGKTRHPNGSPFACQSFALIWDEKASSRTT